MSIQVDDVIKVLSKIYNFIEDDNIVNEENILNYETDDIEPIRVRIYTESNKFDIFKEYSFDDWSLNCDDDFESDYGYKEDILINFRKSLLRFNLERIVGVKPHEEVDDFCAAYGCPDKSYNIYVGYWNQDISEDLINRFMESENSIRELSGIYTTDNVYDAIDVLIAQIPEYKKLLKSENEYYKCKYLYISSIKYDLKSFFSDEEKLVKAKHFYKGTENILIKFENGFIGSINLEAYNIYEQIISLISIFEIPQIYTDSNEYIYLTDSYINCLFNISGYSEARDLEQLYLQEMIDKFTPFRNPRDVYLYDFSHLTATQFEKLCYDLLIEMKFVDVHPIGKTNATDGGRDIIANEIVKGAFGDEKRLWIFQCKHSKKSLDRKDVAEIGDLLEENNAQRYGLFCSNDLSSSAINRIQAKNRYLNGCIHYWGKIEMQSLLNQYPNIVSRYAFLPQKTI